MKRLLFFLLLFLLFIPVVSAVECKNCSVSIESISLDDSDHVKELAEAKVTEQDIELQLKMVNVGDSIQYKIVLKNDSNRNYELESNSISSNSEYVDYILMAEDDSTMIQSHSSKTMILMAQYNRKIPDDIYRNGEYIDSVTIPFELSTDENAYQSNEKTSYLLLIAISFVIFVLIFFGYKKYRSMKEFIFILCLLCIPVSVFATCQCNLHIDSTVTFKQKQYVYSNTSQTVGQGLNQTSVYTNLKEALESFSHYYIIRLAVDEQSIVEGSDIVFVVDGKAYSLHGGDYGVSFDDNLSQLVSAFGDDHCRREQVHTICTNDRLSVRVYETGKISITDGRNSCVISENGTSICN